MVLRVSRVSLIIFMVLSEEVSECSFIIFAVSTTNQPTRRTPEEKATETRRSKKEQEERGMRRRRVRTKLLDKLLVTLELVEGVHVAGVDLEGGGLVAVKHVSENAELHAGLADLGEADGTRKTLVLGDIVVLKSNLELDSLDESSLLGLLGVPDDIRHGLLQNVVGDLTHR